MIEVIFVLIILFIVFALLYDNARKKISELKLQLDDLISRKKSLSAKYGKMSEQFFPFLESYPYDKENFRFMGSPIDGMQFEKDKIIFVEFKIGDSQLTARQKEIRDLVNNGKVEFREFRIE